MYAWLEEIKTQPTKKPFPILSFPGIQYMDGLTVRELVCSAQLQAECMKKVADLKGNPLLLFVNAWSVGMTQDRNPGLILTEFSK